MKRSKHEREQRAQETARAREIEAAWFASLPPETVTAFTHDAQVARERGPLPPRPDMAPGTPPRPPRPGREPKPPKDDRRPRRRAF